MAQIIILLLTLALFFAQGAVLKSHELKREKRSCHVCENNDGGPPRLGYRSLPGPFGPPPFSPFFRSHQWTGYARGGGNQGIFSGAAAAADLGPQAAGQAFSLASSSASAGTGGQESGGQNLQQKSAGFNPQLGFSGQEAASSSQSVGFGGQTIGFNSQRDKLNAGSESFKESQRTLYGGGEHFDKHGEAGVQGIEGQQQVSSKDFSGSGSGFGNRYFDNIKADNHKFDGQEQVSSKDFSSSGAGGESYFGSSNFGKYRGAHGQEFESQQQLSPKEYSASGAKAESSFGNRQDHNVGVGSGLAYGSGSFGKQQSESGASTRGFGHGLGGVSNEGVLSEANAQQLQHSGSGKWESYGLGSSSGRQSGAVSGDSGLEAASAPTGAAASASASGQETLSGALNLASQGLQASQQSGCSTCGKSSYALSNAKSYSGNAVAVSIGG